MSVRVVGRYEIHDEIGSGGMATLHVGRLLGPVGFVRTIALKRLHPQFAKDPEFVAMFLDEARIAGRIRHPNVVSTLDVVAAGSELFLVMDYIQGESVAFLVKELRRRGERFPPAIAVAIAYETLLGLHAAHEATDDRGVPLAIVHRDVSPQNVLVGIDGISRVVDFGIAKAVGRLQTTQDGQIKGKTAYMSPEQLRADRVDRRSDVYAVSVMLWEMLAGKRLFLGDSPAATMVQVLERVVEPPSVHAPGITPALDAVVLRGLARDPESRFATAREMATALIEAGPREAATAIGDWVHGFAGDVLADRAARIARMDGDTAGEATDASASVEISRPSAAVSPATPLAPTDAPRGGRAPRVLFVAVGAGVLAIAAVASYELGARRPDPVGSAGATAAAPVEATPPSSPSSAVATTSPAPADATVPAPQAEVSVTSATDPLRGPSTTPSDAPPAKRPRAAGPPKPRPVSCTPPYTIDANGFHIPKPQCL